MTNDNFYPVDCICGQPPYISHYDKGVKILCVNPECDFNLSISTLQAIDAVVAWNQRINKLGESMEQEINKGELSDGYHTFNELYEHRYALFAHMVAYNKDMAWKSLKHDDGSMFEGQFIAGVDFPTGAITYHMPLRLWYFFVCKEVENAPKWDGYTSKDVITRIYDTV